MLLDILQGTSAAPCNKELCGPKCIVPALRSSALHELFLPLENSGFHSEKKLKIGNSVNSDKILCSFSLCLQFRLLNLRI